MLQHSVKTSVNFNRDRRRSSRMNFSVNSALYHPLRPLLSISTRYITEMVSPSSEGFQKSKSLKRCLHTALYYLWLLGALVRVLLLALVLNVPGAFISARQYFAYDLLVGLFYDLGFVDGFLALVLWPAVFMVAFLDYSVHFLGRLSSSSVTPYCYHLGYDLVVANRAAFFSLNPQLNWLKILVNLQDFWSHSDGAAGSSLYTQRVKFNVHRLDYFPDLHHSVRRRALLISYAFDLVIAAFLILFGLLGVFGLYFYFFNIILPAYPLWKAAIIFVDGATVFYVVWHSAKISFFFIHVLNLIIYVHIAQQETSNRALAYLLSGKVPSARVYPQTTLSNFLLYYIRAHFRLIQDITRSNAELISSILLLILLTMFGINVYAVSALMLKELNFQENMLLLMLCALQTFFILLVLKPMLDAVRTITSPVKYLYAAQLSLLGPSSALLKLKVSVYYEVLNTEHNKFAFTVGPLAKITTEAVFKFCLIYAAYLMFSMNLIRK